MGLRNLIPQPAGPIDDCASVELERRHQLRASACTHIYTHRRRHTRTHTGNSYIHTYTRTHNRACTHTDKHFLAYVHSQTHWDHVARSRPLILYCWPAVVFSRIGAPPAICRLTDHDMYSSPVSLRSLSQSSLLSFILLRSGPGGVLARLYGIRRTSY